MPIICSATAVGIMWKMFLNSEIGLFTYFLEQIGIKGVNFMNSTSLTFYVLVFTVDKAGIPESLTEISQTDKLRIRKEILCSCLYVDLEDIWYFHHYSCFCHAECVCRSL